MNGPAPLAPTGASNLHQYLLVLTVFLHLVHRDMSMPRLTKDDMVVLGELGEDFGPNCTGHECPRIYAPVCAYDNQTYVNECKLYCVNSKRKKKRKRYHIKYYGPCMPFRRFNNFMFTSTPNDTVFERMILVKNKTVLHEALDLEDNAKLTYIPDLEKWRHLVHEEDIDVTTTRFNESVKIVVVE